MKSVFFILLFTFLCLHNFTSYGQKSNAEPSHPILYIKYGYAAGGRGGSSSREQVIDSTKIIHISHSFNRSSMEKKDQTDTTFITSADWNRITQNISAAKFFTLPARTGCGSCRDAEDHWLEISTTERTYRIVYETADYDIQQIVDQLPPLKR